MVRYDQQGYYDNQPRDYSRDAVKYASGGSHGRKGGGKGVGRVLITLLVVIVLAAVAFSVWFMVSLDKELDLTPTEREDLSKVLVSARPNEPFYMLLLGSDSREGANTSYTAAEQGDQQRSDVIILARVDAPNKTVTLVSVPRDTPYTLDNGTVVKVNEAYNIGGMAASVKAVSDITGVDIAHVAELRVSELEAIVDSLGGVEVYVDRELEVHDTQQNVQYFIPQGLQTLNGKQAQVFARDRHSYGDAEEGADYHRQGNVRTLLQAIVKKALSRPAYELPGTILDLAQYVTTDLKTADLVPLGMAFSGGGMTMYSCTGPSKGGIIEQYGNLWYCYPNPEGWAALMAQVDRGIEPGGIDFEATQIIP